LRQDDLNSVKVETSDTYSGYNIQNILTFDNKSW
jgi:hypothetical protein